MAGGRGGGGGGGKGRSNGVDGWESGILSKSSKLPAN